MCVAEDKDYATVCIGGDGGNDTCGYSVHAEKPTTPENSKGNLLWLRFFCHFSLAAQRKVEIERGGSKPPPYGAKHAYSLKKIHPVGWIFCYPITSKP